jgi:hypothetical protein
VVKTCFEYCCNVLHAITEQALELTKLIVQVESQPGLVALPMEQLQSEARAESRANTSNWSAKMRSTFSELASKANSAYEAASEQVKKAAGVPRGIRSVIMVLMRRGKTTP